MHLLPEGVAEKSLTIGSGGGNQDSDSVDPPCLLRPSGERRGQDTGQRGQHEAAAVHHFCPSSKSRTASRKNSATRAFRS